ncbi:hypothetical protein Goshw_029673 [Gossypium schwendimanii]|uniref:Uncharacterized protein n=1 Tax=Gossypium schwendimanii TaxID=34291 RepID=A0A7J9L6F7_GOSSC|nr:hypothetical protein [Gossypium schwendimanii]
MLAQSKTKKEYKKLMVEMVNLMDSGSEDEKSSTSSIKTVDFAYNTTSRLLARKDERTVNNEDSLQ